MATPLFSKQINFSIDGSIVAFATDFSMSVSRDMIEIGQMASTVRSKQQIPDLYSYSISGSGMTLRTADVSASEYGLASMMETMLTTDASIAWAITPDVTGNTFYSGAGYFSSISQDGGVGAAVSYSFEVVGEGDITIGTVPA